MDRGEIRKVMRRIWILTGVKWMVRTVKGVRCDKGLTPLFI